MIVLENLTKQFTLNGRRKIVADNINAVFPTGVSIGLLGRNGAGKSTLLQMIAGTILPTSGRILTTGEISWPVGLASSFHRDLTGEQNVLFIARIYGVDTNMMCDFVQEFAELGDHFRMPFRTYSSGMRARLAFAASMAVPFETYLIDEVTAVGDAKFRQRSEEIMNARLGKSAAIVVSHSFGTLRRICQAGAVLDNGRLTYYPVLEEAIERHLENMQ